MDIRVQLRPDNKPQTWLHGTIARSIYSDLPVVLRVEANYFVRDPIAPGTHFASNPEPIIYRQCDGAVVLLPQDLEPWSGTACRSMPQEPEGIVCPSCEGEGRVSDLFLTDDHVSTVFADYCKIFGIRLAYGVESWTGCSDTVDIAQDISCRGCHDTDHHSLPLSWFTRNLDKRLELMRQAHAEAEKKKKEAEAERARAKLRWARKEVARLEKEQEELGANS